MSSSTTIFEKAKKKWRGVACDFNNDFILDLIANASFVVSFNLKRKGDLLFWRKHYFKRLKNISFRKK